jgi:hypothetical protein
MVLRVAKRASLLPNAVNYDRKKVLLGPSAQKIEF